MGDGLETVWQIEPHTIAKHMILKNYLQAWFRIMGAYNEKIVFMDGYAGPGEYSNGEEGSPIIALKEAMNYLDSCEKNGWKKPEIIFLFIEQDKDRFSTLEKKIREMKLPKELKVSLENSSFELITKDILSYLEKEQAKLAPSFIFIDPFGYNLPFELIQRLMKYEKCEVFINFMYEFINRFIRRDGQDSVMTRLFGTEDWKKIGFDELAPQKRKEVIHNLYKEQLEKHAASYVRSFEMRGKKNTTKYFLFYGTNHKRGLEKMKEAMWKVDSGGAFSFSDATDPNQLVFFGNEPYYDYLKQLILDKFRGKQASIDQIEEFVLLHTPFLATHIRKPILVPLEKDNKLSIISSPRKKKNTYPSGTILEIH